jgi:hypothetical protein
MSPSLEDRFPLELSALVALFGQTQVANALPRLNQIHEYTEAKWRDYVARLRDRRVSCLLIAEAPPWSATGMPQYVLDPASDSRVLMKALRGTFLRSSVSTQFDADRALAEFAQQGLLIVDSIPFAMDYRKKRSRRKYNTLVRLTAQSYLREKLLSASLSWSPNLCVAFGFKLNALAIMNGLDNHLDLGQVRLVLGAEQIAVNDAGYPDAGKLRALFAPCTTSNRNQKNPH